MHLRRKGTRLGGFLDKEIIAPCWGRCWQLGHGWQGREGAVGWCTQECDLVWRDERQDGVVLPNRATTDGVHRGVLRQWPCATKFASLRFKKHLLRFLAIVSRMTFTLFM